MREQEQRRDGLGLGEMDERSEKDGRNMSATSKIFRLTKNIIK